MQLPENLMEYRIRTWYYRNAVRGIRAYVESIVSDKWTNDKWVYFKAMMDACERDAEICRELIEFKGLNLRYVNHKHKNPSDPKSKLIGVEVVMDKKGGV